jgi:pimeloyl-ACP methyl ester carboxylesterase
MKHAYADLSCGQIYYDTAGEGEPLICLHQSIWSNWEFSKLIPLLAKKYRVVAPDTIGFGRSDPAPHGWMVLDYAKAVIEFMDVLGIKKAHFLGQHTGAFFGTEIAASFPQRINKIVFSGLGLFNLDFVPYTPDPTGLWAISTVTQNVRERIANRSMPLNIPVTKDYTHIQSLWASQLHENPASSMDGIQKAFQGVFEFIDKRGGNPFAALLQFDMEARARQVKNPSLLTIGTKDCFYPPVCKPPEMMAGILPNCTMRYVEGAGIMGMYTHAEEYAKVILEFLGTK